MVFTEVSIVSLQDYFRDKNIKIDAFLDTAITIAEELAKLHGNNVIHRDINTGNIIIDMNSKKAIIKQSMISMKANSKKLYDNSEKIEGNLRYIAPEQTRIINMPIDFRADLYSLGIVFYELLTGKPPFTGQDPGELIHAHIAIKPVPPQDIKVNVPGQLSDIILRLLKKAPNKRYQSVFGLLADLKKCQKQFKLQGRVKDFKLGQHDISPVFKIPEKLYGRKEESALLKKLYANVKRGEREILFISGPPGIGKTFLIKETQNHFMKKGGYFISGKFDQYKRDIPYSAIINAFEDLIRQLLTKSEKELNLIKDNLMSALGINARIIIDVIPGLELILGQQKQLECLNPLKAKNRFNYVFQNFIKLFASVSHPLILFLDDLQWADSASIELIEVLFSDSKLSSMLFIGAFRDIESEDNLSLMRMTGKFQNSKLNCQTMALQLVDREYITTVLKDTLVQNMLSSDPFVSLILDKTCGNPFFVKEFLIDLYKKGYITSTINAKVNNIGRKKIGWLIDMEGIACVGLPFSVVDLISARIQKLSNDTINILKLASCIGIKFAADVLSKIHGITANDLTAHLKKASQEGIIIKKASRYMFIHDKVQELVYDLIDPTAKEAIHYSIGKLLLKRGATEKGNDDIFKILHQLNIAKKLLSAEERNILIKLNLQAGNLAKASTAYHSTVHFLKEGMKLLSEDSWSIDYKTTFSYFTELSEAEYLTGNYLEAEKLFAVVFSKATSLYDRIKLYELKIDCYTRQMKYNDVFNTAKVALKELGFSLPAKIGRHTIFKEKFKIMLKLKRKDIAGLINLPTVTDPKICSLIKIMVKIADAAYTTESYLFAFLTIKGVDLTLKHGNCQGTAYFFSRIAALFCQPGLFTDINKGCQFSKLALNLNDKYYSRSLHIRILFANTYVSHWQEPLKNNLKNYLNVIDLCLHNGDSQYLNFSYLFYTTSYLLMGKSLKETVELFNEYTHHIKKNKPLNTNSYFFLVKQALNNNSTESLDRLFLTSFFLIKSFIFYLYGEHKKGIDLGKNESLFIDGLYSNPSVPMFYFFYALHLSANYHNSNRTTKIKYYYKLQLINHKFKKWGLHNKSTYYQMYLLISAEIARLNKKDDRAVNLYKEAIELAGKNEFLYCQAIASECAGKFYLERDMLKEASHYINAAYHCYELWQAKTKLKQLKKAYPDFLSGHNDWQDKATNPAHFNNQDHESHTCSLSTLDLQSITMASNLIIANDVSKTLSNLVKILTKNFGAERTVLLLGKEKKLSIETECIAHNGHITETRSLTLKEDSIPESIIRFVKRTGETVLIANAAKEINFMDDKYILEKKPQSILCIPVVHQTNFISILYMENNHSTDVFTFERVKILKYIINQIALLIENSVLNKKLLTERKKKDSESELLLADILKKRYNLTKQEIKIVLLFKTGANREEICSELNISYNTLRAHLRVIYEKTINKENATLEKIGRVDKLSQLILFLSKLDYT